MVYQSVIRSRADLRSSLTVCFLCRFSLDLRGVYYSETLESELERSMHLSSMNFPVDMIGNLGASLRTSFPCHGFREDSDVVCDVETDRYDDSEDDEELPSFTSDPFKEGVDMP